jgi:hypothetical protein
MYITEYWTINKTSKIAIRGVMMYREKRDLAEKRRGKVLAVFVVYRAFPKRIQRRDMWKRLCWKELKHIHVEVSNYYKWSEQFVGLGKSDSKVYGFEVRALRRRLGLDQKKLFDQFYYQKKNGYKEKQRMYII